MNELIKKPSAFIPILMSLAALTLLISYIAIFGISQQPQQDEGTVAHIWQILMGGQVPIIAFFAIKHFHRKPKPTLIVLAIQIAVFLASFALLFFFER